MASPAVIPRPAATPDLDAEGWVATTDPPWAELRAVKLRAVRGCFSEACYQRSAARALGWLAFDLTLYAAALAGVFTVGHPIAQLGFGVIAGCAVAFLFVWGHDAAHGALFASGRWSEALGTVAMLPSLNMYRMWSYGHNKVHHGFTSFSPIDWIWRPLTPQEYRSRSRAKRLVYRLERRPATCGLHYLLRVWWPGMVRFRPNPKLRRTRGFRAAKLGTLAFALVASAVAYRFAGGPWGVVAAVLVPFGVFNWFIALFVYLHHTHPDVPFFDDRREWNATVGQVYCSTVVRCSRVTELLTHHILVHTPHHVDTRIPFYRLEVAYADLRPGYGRHIHEYRFRWSTVRAIFAACQLFDFDTKTWSRFSDVAGDRGRPAA